MTIDQFKATLSESEPPAGIHPVLQGLWYDASGNWEAAHTIAQGQEGMQPHDRLHAYLHRKEGDRFNANYWYRRIGESYFDGSLDEEWDVLVTKFLS
jgi:hypothetical protein